MPHVPGAKSPLAVTHCLRPDPESCPHHLRKERYRIAHTWCAAVYVKARKHTWSRFFYVIACMFINCQERPELPILVTRGRPAGRVTQCTCFSPSENKLLILRAVEVWGLPLEISIILSDHSFRQSGSSLRTVTPTCRFLRKPEQNV